MTILILPQTHDYVITGSKYAYHRFREFSNKIDVVSIIKFMNNVGQFFNLHSSCTSLIEKGTEILGWTSKSLMIFANSIFNSPGFL